MKENRKALHRHDISDRLWEKIEGLLPGRAGKQGRMAQDNRRFINAVSWIIRTGAPWRDLPPEYGDWKNTHRWFCR
jgi:transposase